MKGLCVCITSHLLGHNVETGPLHYLALHGCPPSCARSALSPQPCGTERKTVHRKVQYVVVTARALPSLYTADPYIVYTQSGGGPLTHSLTHSKQYLAIQSIIQLLLTCWIHLGFKV